MSKLQLKIDIYRKPSIDRVNGLEGPDRWHWTATNTNQHGEMAKCRDRGYGRMRDAVHSLEVLTGSEIKLTRTAPGRWSGRIAKRPLVKIEVES